MTRSPAAVLFTTPVLAPTPVLDAMSLPPGTRVAAPNDLPTGWTCVLLNLWPDVLEDKNRSLIATQAKPRPNPHVKRSDGELLRSLRRRVHGWLNATDVPVAEMAGVSEMRRKSYSVAAVFATGQPDGWGAPLVAAKDRKPVTVKDRARRPHKPHGPRRDLYWALTTDKGHRVLYKAASAVGRAMSSGTAPVPPGWRLTRGIEHGDGTRGTAVKKILRVRADYDADVSVTLQRRLAIEVFVSWIRAAVSHADGR